MSYLKNNIGLIIILLLSLLPLYNLLTPGLPISHDGIDHIARIANFYINLNEGVIIPRWAGNLNWGYGHPILMFLYPLPSYMASIYHFVGFSYIDSYKIVLGSTYIFSGIFMYLWLKRFLGIQAAVVGSVFYLYAPYRFIDLYVRGAIGEHVAFAFIPLVLLSLLLFNKLSARDNLRKYYFGSIFIAFSVAGLILSHNAISLLFISFILFYILYLFIEHKSKAKGLLSLFSVGFGFLLSAFFWFPAFFEGKYTLRDIVTNNQIHNHFTHFSDLIYGSWSFGGSGQFSVQIGLIQILIVFLSVIIFFKLFKKNDKQKYLYLGTLLLFLSSVFLMLEQSRFIWENISTLQKFQFPWRFLTIIVFCVSLIGAIFVSKVNINRKDILVFLLVLLAIIPTINYWQAKEYKKFDDSKFNSIIESTTDTGESAPIWSIRFMEIKPESVIEIIEGDAEIVNLERKSTLHKYVIDVKDEARIRENTLYFPGWKIYDNGSLIENVEFQDPKNRGIITFRLEKGVHDVVLKFEETKLRYTTNIISLFAFLLLFTIPLFLYLITKTKFLKIKW